MVVFLIFPLFPLFLKGMADKASSRCTATAATVATATAFQYILRLCVFRQNRNQPRYRALYNVDRRVTDAETSGERERDRFVAGCDHAGITRAQQQQKAQH